MTRVVNLCRWHKNIFTGIFRKKIKKNIQTCKRIFPYEIEYTSILKPSESLLPARIANSCWYLKYLIFSAVNGLILQLPVGMGLHFLEHLLFYMNLRQNILSYASCNRSNLNKA